MLDFGVSICVVVTLLNPLHMYIYSILQMYVCIRVREASWAGAGIVKKEVNQHRVLAGQCLMLHQFQFLIPIRWLRGRPWKNLKKNSICSCDGSSGFFVSWPWRWFSPTCGGKISALEHAGNNTPDKTVYPTLIAIRAFESNDLRRIETCSFWLSGCFSRNDTWKRPSQIAFPPLTRKTSRSWSLFTMDSGSGPMLFSCCSAA